MRQRTKEHVEFLEEYIKFLESGVEKLQEGMRSENIDNVLKKNQESEDENRMLRGQLALAMSEFSSHWVLAPNNPPQPTLLHIVTNPRVQSKLLEEISNSSISTPITDGQARKLPHLQAVIKEGLRIFPRVTGFMSKQAPPGGDTINGLYFANGQ
jgi:hypothetical protein